MHSGATSAKTAPCRVRRSRTSRRETHSVLRQRAARAHQSLQEYLPSRLIEEAAIPTLEEVLERAANRTGGSVPLSAAAKAVRSDRDRR